MAKIGEIDALRLDAYCQLEDGTSIDLEIQVGSENDDQVKRAVY